MLFDFFLPFFCACTFGIATTSSNNISPVFMYLENKCIELTRKPVQN